MKRTNDKFLFVAQVCSLLTSNSKVICRFTRDKTLLEQGGAWKSPRNAITIPTGAPPRGRTLLLWSAIRRPRRWWKNTSTVLVMGINVGVFFVVLVWFSLRVDAHTLFYSWSNNLVSWVSHLPPPHSPPPPGAGGGKTRDPGKELLK